MAILAAAMCSGTLNSSGSACNLPDATRCCPELTTDLHQIAIPVDSEHRSTETPLANVAIFGFQFTPGHILVPMNARVRWTNYDSSLHTSTSLDMPPVWDSGFLPEPASYTYDFSITIRTYPYFCAAHPDMIGSVEVRLPGDATGDNSVNISDFSILASNFNTSPRTYSQGDFNLNGTAEIGDFAILAANFNTSAGSRGAAIPEPAETVAVLLFAGPLARRWRSAC